MADTEFKMSIRIHLPIPQKCVEHILDHVADGRITRDDAKAAFRWCNKRPTVVFGKWFKTFNNFYLVGSDSAPTSVLNKIMVPQGIEVF